MCTELFIVKNVLNEQFSLVIDITVNMEAYCFLWNVNAFTRILSKWNSIGISVSFDYF